MLECAHPTNRVWNEDVIACLLLSGAVSHMTAPDLVTRLIERRNVALMELAMRCVLDLSETRLVEMLQFALSEARSRKKRTGARAGAGGGAA